MNHGGSRQSSRGRVRSNQTLEIQKICFLLESKLIAFQPQPQHKAIIEMKREPGRRCQTGAVLSQLRRKTLFFFVFKLGLAKPARGSTSAAARGRLSSGR